MGRGGRDAKEIANILIILLEVVFTQHPPTVLCYCWTQNKDLMNCASTPLVDPYIVLFRTILASCCSDAGHVLWIKKSTQHLKDHILCSLNRDELVWPTSRIFFFAIMSSLFLDYITYWRFPEVWFFRSCLYSSMSVLFQFFFCCCCFNYWVTGTHYGPSANGIVVLMGSEMQFSLGLSPDACGLPPQT